MRSMAAKERKEAEKCGGKDCAERERRCWEHLRDTVVTPEANAPQPAAVR